MAQVDIFARVNAFSKVCYDVFATEGDGFSFDVEWFDTPTDKAKRITWRIGEMRGAATMNSGTTWHDTLVFRVLIPQGDNGMRETIEMRNRFIQLCNRNRFRVLRVGGIDRSPEARVYICEVLTQPY